MIKVSEPTNLAPRTYSSELQVKVYDMLHKLGIKFQRVDNEPAITMEDCEAIDQALDMKTVKTLFLTNRQKTLYYLCVMPGNKPFSTKDFGQALGVSRVSFAPAGLLMSKMGTVIGAATIFSAMMPGAADVRIIVDRDVTEQEWYGCTDGTTTSYLKLATADVLGKLIPAIGREIEVVQL